MNEEERARRAQEQEQTMSPTNPMADVLKPLTLETVNKGRLEEDFQWALREYERSLDDPNRDPKGEAVITLTVRIAREDQGFRAITACKAVMPGRKKRGGIVAMMRDGNPIVML